MKQFLLSFFLVLGLTFAYGTGGIDTTKSSPPLAKNYSIWLNHGLIKKGPDSIPGLLDTCQKAGITTIDLNLWFHGYVLYPGSKLATQHPDFIGWDPVNLVIDEAHKRGMKVNAWTEYGFFVHYNYTGDSTDLGPVLSQHPEWAAIDRNGHIPLTNEKEKFSHYILCPANPDAQDFLILLFTEMVTQYPFDGINLDRIRFPNDSYCYDKYCRDTFKKEFHIDPISIALDDGVHQQMWDVWRKEQLVSFIHRMSVELRKNRPGLMITSAVVPTGMISEKLQDWPAWTRNGDLDLPVPMAYGAAGFVQKQVEETKRLIGTHPFSIGIDITQSPENVKKILDYLKSLHITNITLWGDDKVDSLKDILSN